MRGPSLCPKSEEEAVPPSRRLPCGVSGEGGGTVFIFFPFPHKREDDLFFPLKKVNRAAGTSLEVPLPGSLDLLTTREVPCFLVFPFPLPLEPPFHQVKYKEPLLPSLPLFFLGEKGAAPSLFFFFRVHFPFSIESPRSEK